MATGDQQNMFDRLAGLLPAGWFGDNNPVRDALLWGYAQALAWAYTLYLYAKAQTRIKTATDGWLDLIALDFFGNNLLRNSNQADSSFRNRILINIFRERTTRHAIEQVLFDLTGRMPKIVEPARPADVGAYGAAVAVSQPGTTTMIDNGKLVYVPPNTPRYQNGVLLIEESRANLLLNSENLLAYGALNGTLTRAASSFNIGLANFVDLIDAGNGDDFWFANVSAVANGLYCVSAAVKKTAGAGYFGCLGTVYSPTVTGRSVVFNPNTGVITATSASGVLASGVIDQGATWRVWMLTQALPDSTTASIRCYPAWNTDGSVTRNNATTGTLTYGMPQIEAGNSVTSYMPTNGASVTRAADTLLNNMPAGSTALGGYGSAGAYGSLVHPYQAFITAYRPSGQGLPYVAGYTIPTGAYSTPSRAVYAQLSPGDVTDADICAAIDSVKPYGSVAWVRIAS